MNNLFDLTNRTALITGAGGLLGPKHAEAIVECGGRVIMTDHHLDRAQEKSEMLNGKYGSFVSEAYHMDVTDPISVKQVVDKYKIAPDQRIYRKEGIPEYQQNVKPITYSAAKWAIIGMTKYLAVYWAKRNIRVNCLSPTGVFNDHPEDFVQKLSNIIPMGRMADINEYKGAVMFLCSDASSYMTGENMVIDGGKTVW